MKVQAESFHLNGHIIGFRAQTQKLESPYKTLSNTLAMKGLFLYTYSQKEAFRVGMQQVYEYATNEANLYF